MRLFWRRHRDDSEAVLEPAGAYTAEESHVISERLRALGYIE